MKKYPGLIAPISWIKAVVYAFLIFFLYLSALQHLVGFDWEKEDFNYCYLMPLIVLYLIWDRKEQLASSNSVASWKGVIPVALGVALFWLGDLGGEYFTMYMSLWLVIVGLVWLHLGWRKLRTIGFSMVMMLGMFPIPDILNVRLTFGLKLISSALGVSLLRLIGMSAFREGNVIDLGFTQLQVVEACSGLRYVIPLLILSLILVYWSRLHIWKRIVLVVSSIPISIIVNAFRIAVTGFLYQYWGAQVAEGFFHDFSGWLIFMFTIPLLLVEMWILGKLPPKENAKRETGNGKRERPKDEESSAGEYPTSDIRHPTSRFFQPVFIIAVVLLGLTAVLSRTVEFREKIPIAKPLKEFPLKIGEWNGQTENMEQQIAEILNFSDYAIINYRDTKGQSVNFYTAYYESQRKGEATHSPETCLPGGGWVFEEAGTTLVPIGDGRRITVKRALMQKGDFKQITYYWFAMRGRVLTNLYQVKWYTFWDALTKRRTDGALVRLITPVGDNEKIEDAEKRLQGFTGLMVPILKEYIPE